MSSRVLVAADGDGILRAESRRLWRLTRVIGHIAWGFVLAVALGAFWSPHRPHVQKTARRWLAGLLGILGVELETRGAPADGPVLFVSNHVSWLDIPVLGAQTGACFLSKAEVRDWPLIGHLAAAAGTLFIKRGNGESGRKASEIAGHLRVGRRILVFPEGTTTDGTALRRFFPQLFQAPVEAGVAVQPVALRYLDENGDVDPELAFIGDDAFHTHLWSMMRRPRVRVRLDYADPLSHGEYDRDQLCREARRAVAERLA